MEYQQYATLHYFVQPHNHSVANLREEDIMRAAVRNWSARLDRAASQRFAARVKGLVARLRGLVRKHTDNQHPAVAA